MVATEIAVLPLKKEQAPHLNDPGSEAGKALSASIKIISSQPGYISCYHGIVSERPTELQLIVNWDNVTSHHNFQSSPSYPPLLSHLSVFITEGAEIQHFHFSPSVLSSILSSPVVEVQSIFFASAFDADPAQGGILEKEYERQIDDFTSAVKKIDGAKLEGKVVYSWSVERVSHKKFVEELQPGGDEMDDQQGKTGRESRVAEGKMGKLLIAWDSVEEHVRVRATKEFQDAVKGLSLGPVGMTMCHVEFKKG